MMEQDQTSVTMGVNGGTSVLDRIRAARERATQDRQDLTLAVPLYEDLVAVKYQRVEWLEIKKIIQKNHKNKSPTRELDLMADILIACHVEILARETQEAEWEQVNPPEPMRFGPELSALFGATVTTARQSLYHFFSNDFNVTVHHARVYRWLQGENDELDLELAGE